MKKIILNLALLFVMVIQAQDAKLVPQINVSGEGKIKVTPDKAIINFGIENIGKDATTVKKINDETVDKVLTFIKKFGIPVSDFQTTQVSLNRTYDYDKKKYNFQAVQSITITLKELSKYDALLMGLVDNGINTITNVTFESSKIEDLKSDARKLAMKEAKRKAEDYVSVLAQKVGKAILISDTDAQTYYPQPMYKTMAFASEDASTKQTVAVGEIEISATVTVSFVLE